ncbi:MAG: LolA family protein [Thermoanaerobaculia bacterium]
MKRKTFACLFLAGLIGSAAWAQTADEIIAKNIEAKGGLAKLKSIQTMRISGKMQMGPGMEAPMVIETSRPNKMRVEFTFQGMTGIQAYDGKTGWMVMPFMGKKDPETMSGDDLKQVEDQADIDGPLVDYKEKGHQVEYLGKGEVEGTPVHKIKVTKKNGDVATIYLDAESFLEIKAEGKTRLRGQDIEGETAFGDYKEVSGMVFAHSIQSKMKGGPGPGQTITFEKIEINPEIPANRFDMPAKAEAPAPPKQQ